MSNESNLVAAPSGDPTQTPVALIQVTLTADGKIHCAAQVPTRAVFLQMMEVAKFDMERKLYESERPKVMMPNPGLRPFRGG